MTLKTESVHAQLLHLCLTLCDPMDCSLPDSSVHGILQARILEWVAIPFSRGSSRSRGSNPSLSFFLQWQADLYHCATWAALKNWIKWSRSVVSDSLRPHGLQPTRLLCPRDFPGNGTGVGCHFLLQGIFPTQGSNPGLPHCRQTLNLLSHQGSKNWTDLLTSQLFI